MAQAKKRYTVADLRILDIKGVEYDAILGWTIDPDKVTVRYSINSKERIVSLESDAIEIGFFE